MYHIPLSLMTPPSACVMLSLLQYIYGKARVCFPETSSSMASAWKGTHKLVFRCVRMRVCRMCVVCVCLRFH